MRQYFLTLAGVTLYGPTKLLLASTLDRELITDIFLPNIRAWLCRIEQYECGFITYLDHVCGREI